MILAPMLELSRRGTVSISLARPRPYKLTAGDTCTYATEAET
jgi:hypothetical protein